MEVPGVGPVLASAMVATVADPKAFKSGRDLASHGDLEGAETLSSLPRQLTRTAYG